MRKRMMILIAVVGSVILPEGLYGVRTSFWDLAGREEMGEGTPETVTIGPLGSLELAPDLEEFGALSEYYVWAAVSDKAGNLYVGTGDQGKIYLIDRNGKSTLIFDSLELDILSLALDSEGNLYAGTSPDGTIFRIGPEGKAKTFFDSPDHYIWSLVFDDDGNLYAGSGEFGKVYRIDSSGDAELFYDSPETNVLTMVWDARRERLLLGGDGNGLLISLDRKGEPRVLFDAPRDEMSALLVTEDGTIYAGAAGDRTSSKRGKNKDKNKNEKNALLYKIEPKGAVILLWESDSEFLYCLIQDVDGTILAGTGSPGKLVRISPEGEVTDLKHLSESQLLVLHRSDEAIYFGTGNQGCLYRLGPGRAVEGTYESKTTDVVNLARWGKLRWWGEAPKETGITLSTRTGNTEDPDDTWTDWQEIKSGDKGGAIQSPPGRFLQWRAELHGDGKRTPRIDRVRIAYKEHNLPPRVLSVDVVRAETRFFAGPSDPRPETLHQVLPDGTRVEYYPSSSSDSEPGEATELWARAVRTVRWEASDANGDQLLYNLYFRADGEREWKLLAEDLELNYYSWDSRSIPDGSYRVRVMARDEGSNPKETTLTGERTSDPFEVDNTAPEIVRLEAKRDGDNLKVNGEARDDASPLLRAEYSLNADAWHEIDPVDDIYDSWAEKFDFTVESSEGKEQVLMLRVTDQAGNVALGKAVVR